MVGWWRRRLRGGEEEIEQKGEARRKLRERGEGEEEIEGKWRGEEEIEGKGRKGESRTVMESHAMAHSFNLKTPHPLEVDGFQQTLWKSYGSQLQIYRGRRSSRQGEEGTLSILGPLQVSRRRQTGVE